jgi:hypothetical protein
MTKTKEKTNTIYKLEFKGSEITESDRLEALTDCANNEHADINPEFLTSGDVIISDDAYYSADKAKLERLIQTSEIKDGDKVYNEKSNRFGTVFTTKANQLRVIYDDGTKSNSVLLTGNWQKVSDAVEQANELIKDVLPNPELTQNLDSTEYREVVQDAYIETLEESCSNEDLIDDDTITALEKFQGNDLQAIDGEIVHEDSNGMSIETHYATIRDSIKHKQSLIQKIPVLIGYDLAEMHEQQLYLCEYKDFETCVKSEFGLSREYAYELMEAAIIHNEVRKELGTEQADSLAIKSFGAFAKTSLEIGKRLGFEGNNSEILASVSEIVRTNIRTVADIAPKRSDGSPIITQQTTKAILETVTEFVTSNTAEYDGEQMPLDKTNESGITSLLAENQALHIITEQIKSKKEYLREHYEQGKKNTEKGVAHNGKLSTSTEIYKGIVPALEIICSQHKETFISSIGNGKIQTACGCRWYIHAETGDLVCYECNDRAVINSVSDVSDKEEEK